MMQIINRIKLTDYDKLYICLLKSGFDDIELLNRLSENTSMINEFLLYYITFVKNDIFFGERVRKLLEINNDSIVFRFRNSVNDGKTKEFLLNSDWGDKCHLWFAINDFFGNNNFSDLLKYLDVINKMMDDEQKDLEYMKIIEKYKEINKELGDKYFSTNRVYKI